VIESGVCVAAATFSVKFWAASGPMPLCAVNVSENVPLVAGVPLSTPVDASKFTPLGTLPLALRSGIGNPVAVTVNVPAVFTLNAVLVALVISDAVPD